MNRQAPKRNRRNRKKTVLKECPNPLFLKWLERWRDEAKANDSKLQYVYNKVRNLELNFRQLLKEVADINDRRCGTIVI